LTTTPIVTIQATIARIDNGRVTARGIGRMNWNGKGTYVYRFEAATT